MQSLEEKLPLIVIVGPTGVGKTGLAIQLALETGGEIVSADASAFYRGMDIGTAKPTKAECLLVPHHLVDTTDPDETWALGKFQQEAYNAIYGIHRRGKTPFLVGGTGQYVRAIVEGWEVPKQEPDTGLRELLENWAAEIGSEKLHHKLKLLDPLAAGNIDHRNSRRVIRALEVILRTGEKFSSQRKKGKIRYQTTILGVNRPREELYSRIDKRIEAMLVNGLVKEVRHLLEVYPPELPAFSAIGYREIIGYLNGEISLEEAVRLMKRRTRQFVRRQANWFKPDAPDIQWFQMSPDPKVEMIEAINAFIRD